MFWWFSCKVLTDESYFVYSSFPTFSLSFSWSYNFKHFCLSHWFYLFDRDWPFTCFFLSFLFNHVSQNFRISLLLSVHQIGGNCTFFNVLYSTLCIFLLMFFYCFLHLYFLFESLFIKDFRFKSSKSLCFFGNNFSFSGIFLSPFLFSVKSLTESFFMKFDIIVLWHLLYNKL